MSGSFPARRLCAALVVVLLGVACTPSPEEREREREITHPVTAATALLEAWSELDAEALSRHVDAAAADAFVARVEDELTRGQITSFEVERAGEVAALDPSVLDDSGADPTTEVPYRIVWYSEASEDPVELEGTFTMRYSVSESEWRAQPDRRWLWPGIRGARHFSVATRWLKRGPIVDREGTPLAVGAVDTRRYPQGSLAGSTVGHLGELTKKDVAAGAEGAPGDVTGASGVEAAFQERLAGQPSRKLLLVGKRARVLDVLGRSRGEPGRKVKLTLDVAVQRAAASAFGNAVGGAVVLHPQTGDLLAVVSSSELDPNSYVGAIDVHPFNRALSGLYPPGSSMKVVTASAAIDTATMRPDTQVSGPKEYKGVRNFESESFDSISFATAMRFSVNTSFAQVAEKLGAKKLTRYARAFGFGKAPEMPLHAATSSFPRPRDLYDLMWGAVGQAQVVATPLQMATVAGTVAAGGKRMEPRIDKRSPVQGERVMSRASAATVTSMMEGVVQGGTGTAARISGVSVAGKTGTAEVDVGGERKNHAWFVCFAPAGRPQVAVAVVVEYGGVGGVVAAPIARSILQGVLPVLP